MRAADVAVQARTAPAFGIEAEVTGVDWPSIRDRKFSRSTGSPRPAAATGRRRTT